MWVSARQVQSHALGVFVLDRDAYLTLLSSNLHFAWWTTKGESTLETRLRYTPSDGFEYVSPAGVDRRGWIGWGRSWIRSGGR